MTLCLFVISLTLGSDYIETKSATDELLKDVKALELFLEDQINHEKYCLDILWEQPDIEVYKEKLETQLPKECAERVPSKKEEITNDEGKKT